MLAAMADTKQQDRQVGEPDAKGEGNPTEPSERKTNPEPPALIPRPEPPPLIQSAESVADEQAKPEPPALIQSAAPVADEQAKTEPPALIQSAAPVADEQAKPEPPAPIQSADPAADEQAKPEPPAPIQSAEPAADEQAKPEPPAPIQSADPAADEQAKPEPPAPIQSADPAADEQSKPEAPAPIQSAEPVADEQTKPEAPVPIQSAEPIADEQSKPEPPAPIQSAEPAAEEEAKLEPPEPIRSAEPAAEEEPKQELDAPAPTKGPAPVITKLRPSGGPPSGGTLVVIEGTGFVEGCTTKVDRVPVSATFISPTELTFTTLPRNVVGRVDVEVINPDEQRALIVLGYEYCPPPLLTRIDPDHGPQTGGIRATLTGEHLQKGIELRIGASRPSFELRSSALLDLTIPAHPSGLYDVEVVTPEGQSACLKDAFRFDPPPRVDRVIPDHGPFAAQTPIVIEGEHFRLGCAVYLGGKLLPSELESSSRIVAAAPPREGDGTVLLRIINVDGLDFEKADGFRYDPRPPPRVTGIEPSRLPRGRESKAVVTGEGFTEGSSVRIDGAVVLARYVSDTRIDVTVPPLDSVGKVDVQVENLDRGSHLLEGAVELCGPPELLSVQPREGSSRGGEILVLTGLWFQQGCQATVGGAAAKTTWESETSLRVLAPAGVRARNGGRGRDERRRAKHFASRRIHFRGPAGPGDRRYRADHWTDHRRHARHVARGAPRRRDARNGWPQSRHEPAVGPWRAGVRDAPDVERRRCERRAVHT